mgnify:CR=1 FL=1
MRLLDTWDREAGLAPASLVVLDLGVLSFSTREVRSQFKTSESIFLNILFNAPNKV